MNLCARAGNGGSRGNAFVDVGSLFSTSGGVACLVSRRTAVTVDAFYTPLWVRREAGWPRTNKGLFNVGALLSDTFH